MKLDELELCLQLILIYNPDLKGRKYQELADIIEVEFGQKVDIQDVFLLHEPTIEEELQATYDYYGSMFNLERNLFI